MDNLFLNLSVKFSYFYTIYSMNYDKIYKQIIEFRKENPLDKDQYGQNHHIIPKSLGGSGDKENLVRLSAREHFICHMLLAEMYPKNSNEWYKMNHAFMQMKSSSSTQIRYINNRYYELKRKDFSKTMSFSQSGNKNSNFAAAEFLMDPVSDQWELGSKK